MNEKVYAIIIIIFSLIINSLITYYSEIFAKENIQNKQPLYDIGHNILPNTSSFRYVNDIFPILFGIIAIYITNSKINLTNFIIANVIIFTFRLIAAYITLLPPSSNIEQYPVLSGGSHDKMFSGHICALLMSTFLILKKHPNLKTYLYMFNLLYILQVIASRDHYSVDAVIAVFISISIAKIYKFV